MALTSFVFSNGLPCFHHECLLQRENFLKSLSCEGAVKPDSGGVMDSQVLRTLKFFIFKFTYSNIFYEF